MNPLNPTLHNALSRVYGHVGITNPGTPASVRHYPDWNREGRLQLEISEGERYNVNCPFCSDTRNVLLWMQDRLFGSFGCKTHEWASVRIVCRLFYRSESVTGRISEPVTEDKIMAKMQKMWMVSSKQSPKPKLPENLQFEVNTKAKNLVESVLKPKHVKSPPENDHFNYITDLWIKWHQGSLHFGATYACPGPTAIVPSFETKFARLEYCGGNRFNLSYMRHTGRWFELFTDLTLDECLDFVRDDCHFEP